MHVFKALKRIGTLEFADTEVDVVGDPSYTIHVKIGGAKKKMCKTGSYTAAVTWGEEALTQMGWTKLEAEQNLTSLTE